MNHSSINGATINGAFGDTTVRSYVNLIAAAFITVNPRVWRRDTVDIQASADIGPVVGRAYRRSVELVIAQAVIVPGYRLYVRFSEVCQAIADITLTARKHARNVATLTAVANIAIKAHKQARNALLVTGVADIYARVIGRVRSALVVTGEAKIDASGRVKPRTKVASPVGFFAQAQIDATGYIQRRSALTVEAIAQIDANLRARVRDLVICYALADILAQAEKYKRIPFDRNAPAERTYVIPAIQTYYVVT